VNMTNRNDHFNPAVLFPRLLSFGATYGDLARIAGNSVDWESWCSFFIEAANRYELLGTDAQDNRNHVSAAHYFRLASIYFHYSQLRLPICELKFELRRRVVDTFSKFVPLSPRPITKFDIPFENKRLPGYWLQAEPRNPQTPTVILVGGLDSAKEVELHRFAQEFLQRGLHCYVFDGPGQGELLGRIPLQFRFEAVLKHVVDRITDHYRPNALGIFGVSMGGFLGIRGMAADDRIRACVSIGGFFNTQILRKLPAFGKELLQYAHQNDANLKETLVEGLTASGDSILRRPLFVIHGTRDHLVDEEQIEQLATWGGEHTKIWRIEGAEHVCADRFAECLPVIGDWMSSTLRASVTPAIVPQ